jgi:hypothetical protein
VNGARIVRVPELTAIADVKLNGRHSLRCLWLETQTAQHTGIHGMLREDEGWQIIGAFVIVAVNPDGSDHCADLTAPRRATPKKLQHQDRRIAWNSAQCLISG